MADPCFGTADNYSLTALCRYVMNMHARAAQPTESVQGPIGVATLKRYITYCRTKCTPRLSVSAAGLLKDHYVQIRQQLVGNNRDDPDAPPSAIPITVRQLEAIVRISESLAKMRLLEEVHESQVREAIRLFEVSTLAASKCEMLAADIGFVDSQTLEEISNCEDQIKRRVPRGDSVSVRSGVADAHLCSVIGVCEKPADSRRCHRPCVQNRYKTSRASYWRQAAPTLPSARPSTY